MVVVSNGHHFRVVYIKLGLLTYEAIVDSNIGLYFGMYETCYCTLKG